MRKILFLVLFMLSVPISAYPQFGKNNVHYNHLNKLYQSYRFDIYHDLDLSNPAELEYLEQVAGNLEQARDWMSSYKIFNYNIEKRIPVLLWKTHSDMESSNLVGGFMPEGVGAFVESQRRRMVLKADFLKPLGRAIGVHELVHEFQMDIENLGIIQKAVGSSRLPNGYYEGCAEFIAGLYDPHTRDEIRRREQRNYASNPKTLPTWIALNNDTVNPYTMWSMIPEFLQEKMSFGIKFCTQPLTKNIKLGEFIYDMSKGELGNPDINSEKFDQKARHYWGTEMGFEVDRINKPKPYEENENFKGRTITPYGHPYPMRSPILSADGSSLAAFTLQNNGVSLVRYLIPSEWTYVTPEDRAKIKDKDTLKQFTGINPVKNLTPQLPPVPWEYIVVQGFETWPFNGSDAAWSSDGKKIAFFARINRDHALVLIEADTGKIIRKFEFDSPVLNQAFSPSFSPDGKWIYFSAAENVSRNIYAINVEEPALLYQVTKNNIFATAPSVSPDGSRIAYIGLVGDYQHLFIHYLKEGRDKQLTFGPFNDNSPSWSHDGSTLVYVSDEKDGIWNLYTLDLPTDTVRQWTDFIGSVETPLFAKGSLDSVYYLVFRDDDQFQDQIYPNFEIFEAKLKKPIRQYVMTDKGEPTNFVFNPNRDLFRFKLDANQISNPIKPAGNWDCRGGGISVGLATYWGMFGQSFLGCSNLLETKQHSGQFAMYGSIRIFDYNYLNQEKRTGWQLGAHHQRMPLYYQFYDIAKRFPNQYLLNHTWLEETSFDFATLYPLNKFNRFEFYSRLSRRSYNVFGSDVNNFDVETMGEYLNEFTQNDTRALGFLKESSGSNLSFGAAYVRDTLLYSGNTWGPFHGNALRAQVEFAPPLGNEFLGYTSVNVSARTYRHLGASSLIAGRAEVLASSKANGDFILLCGPERLRGCDYGSVIGNQVGYASAELRFPIPGTHVLYQGMRGFLFADAAYSRFNEEVFSSQKMKAYGFGLQYIIPLVGLPAQHVWTRNNGKWSPTFYITLHW